MLNASYNDFDNAAAFGSRDRPATSRLMRLIRGRSARVISTKSCPQTQRRTEAALQLYAIRRERSRFFPDDLFAEPAWDMLLILYWAEMEQVRLTVSNVCEAAQVPATTALRWINGLEEEGLILRSPHPSDGRVFRLSLSRDAIERMNELMDRVLAVGFSDLPSRTPVAA